VKPQEPKNFDYQEASRHLSLGRQVGRFDWVTQWLELDPASGRVVHYDDGVRSEWTPSPEDRLAKWGLR
jgi:hypothetical protein